MKIKVRELKQGVEVDMPVEWKKKPVRQLTIKYDAKNNRFVLADIKTGEIHYSYSKLKDLIRTTNKIYNYDDVAIDDEEV
jgi:hypothetical protein